MLGVILIVVGVMLLFVAFSQDYVTHQTVFIMMGMNSILIGTLIMCTSEIIKRLDILTNISERKEESNKKKKMRAELYSGENIEIDSSYVTEKKDINKFCQEQGIKASDIKFVVDQKGNKWVLKGCSVNMK